jgi:hypothetical protein
LLVTALVAAVVGGCGDGGAGEEAGDRAGEVAVAFAAAMSRLDVHEACRLSFTDRHGPAYRGQGAAAKKRECEDGLLRDHPLHPGAPGPPEPAQVKRLDGLAPAVVKSVEVAGDSATVVLRAPRTGEQRRIRLVEEDGRWLVYEVEVGELIGP